MNEKEKDIYSGQGAYICDECGAKDNFRDVITDQIDYIETEKDRICNKCNGIIDAWAYGFWMKGDNE